MGSDIYSFAERRRNEKWERIPDYEPFGDGRSYRVWAWLAGVRNDNDITPFAEPRGVPEDTSLGRSGPHNVRCWCKCSEVEAWLDDGHSHTHFLLQELLDVDYDTMVEERRRTEAIGNRNWNNVLMPKGEGKMVTLREFLGSWYFEWLERMKLDGVERITCRFD